MTATPCPRLSVWYRMPLVMLFVAVAGVVGPTGHALANATVASPSPSPTEPCQSMELDLSEPPQPLPAVYAPGQVDTQQVTLHNPTSADFTDAFFRFQLTPVPNTIANATTIAPSVSWSIDGSGSPGMTFHWFSVPAPASSFWRADDTALPTLAAGSTHTLRFQASFHADSQAGWYDVDLVITAHTCDYLPLAEAFDIAFIYYTAEGRGGFGSRNSSPPGQVGAGKPASAPSTAPASATPSVFRASPSATESVDTVIAAAPSASATPTPKQTGDISRKGPPQIAWLGALLLAAVAALVSLWGRVVNPGHVPRRTRLGYRRLGASRRTRRTGTDDDS